MKKILALILAFSITVLMAACTGETTSSAVSEGTGSTAAQSNGSAAGSVYYLNFKPEPVLR